MRLVLILNFFSCCLEKFNLRCESIIYKEKQRKFCHSKALYLRIFPCLMFCWWTLSLINFIDFHWALLLFQKLEQLQQINDSWFVVHLRNRLSCLPSHFGSHLRHNNTVCSSAEAFIQLSQLTSDSLQPPWSKQRNSFWLIILMALPETTTSNLWRRNCRLWGREVCALPQSFPINTPHQWVNIFRIPGRRSVLQRGPVHASIQRIVGQWRHNHDRQPSRQVISPLTLNSKKKKKIRLSCISICQGGWKQEQRISSGNSGGWLFRLEEHDRSGPSRGTYAHERFHAKTTRFGRSVTFLGSGSPRNARVSLPQQLES